MFAKCYARHCQELPKIDVILINAKLGFCDRHSDAARQIIIDLNRERLRWQLEQFESIVTAEDALRATGDAKVAK